MILTINISKEELLALGMNDPRALESLSELTRYTVFQGIVAARSDMIGFEFFTIVSPPIALTGGVTGKSALCVPGAEGYETKVGEISHPDVKTEVPDVFKRMVWGDEQSEGVSE